MIGDYVDIQQAKQLQQTLAAETNLPTGRCLVSFYGFPGMPAPPLGLPSGAGRLPEGISRRWAGHPALWLPPSTRGKLPQEINQQYLIRLWLELCARGYWDNVDDTHGWIDALALAGWQSGDPINDSRLQEFAAGEQDDDDLNCFELASGMMADLPPDWSAKQSRVLFLQHELAYQQVRSLQFEAVLAQLYHADRVMQTYDPSTITAPLVRMFSQAPLGVPGWDIWHQVQQKAQSALYQVHQLHNEVLQLLLAGTMDDMQYHQAVLVAQDTQQRQLAALDNALQQWKEGHGPAELYRFAQDLHSAADQLMVQGKANRANVSLWEKRQSAGQQQLVQQLEQELAEANQQLEALHV